MYLQTSIQLKYMIVTNLALKRSLILDNIFLSKTSYSYQLMDQVLTLNIYVNIIKNTIS